MSIKRVCLDKEGNVTEVEFCYEISAARAATEIAQLQRLLHINWESGPITEAQREFKRQKLEEVVKRE